MSSFSDVEFTTIPVVEKETMSKWAKYYFFLGLALFSVLLFQGPIIQPDTGSYESFHVLRSPLYPLLLKLYGGFFSHSYFPLVFLQLIAGFYAAAYFVKNIRKIINFKQEFAGILFFILLVPYYGPSKIGNAILTEAICYPLFLLTVSFLLNGVIKKDLKSILYTFAMATLLVLTRKQFLFLFPGFAIFLCYFALSTQNVKKTSILIFTFILMIVGTHLLEKTYHYIYTGKFKSIPFTGMQLVIAPLYVAKDSDVAFFKTDLQKNIFLKTRALMHQNNQSYDSLNKKTYFDVSVYNHFYENYNTLCWKTLSSVITQEIKDIYAIDSETIKMALILIQHNLTSYISLYLLNIISNIGGFYYTILLITFFGLSMFYFIKEKNNFALISITILSLSASNYLLVALVEPVLKRYTHYTDTIQITLILILLYLVFQDKSKWLNR